MNKPKYSNNISIGDIKIKCSIKKRIKAYNNNTASNLFTFIEISRRQKYSPSSVLIRLCTLRYKRQDRVGNDDSVRIRSVLCKDTQFRKNSVSLV